MWYEVKVSYERQVEDCLRKVSEVYVVPAVTYTDAEVRITEELTPQAVGGMLEIKGIKEVKYAEIVVQPDLQYARYYKAKVGTVILDSLRGTSRVTQCLMLIKASDYWDAAQSLREALRGSMSDYTVSSIAETNIVDVLPAEV